MLEAEKEYQFCKCGKSQAQPFCDGSHEASGVSPLMFTVPQCKKYRLCGCKQTRTQPFCDATHQNLSW